MRRWRMITAGLTGIVLGAGLALGGATSASAATAGHWGAFEVSGTARAYTGSIALPGFPETTFTSNSRQAQVISGATTGQGPATPPGAVYGNSRDNTYMNQRPASDRRTRGAPTTTYTFAAPHRVPAGGPSCSATSTPTRRRSRATLANGQPALDRRSSATRARTTPARRSRPAGGAARRTRAGSRPVRTRRPGTPPPACSSATRRRTTPPGHRVVHADRFAGDPDDHLPAAQRPAGLPDLVRQQDLLAVGRRDGSTARRCRTPS